MGLVERLNELESMRQSGQISDAEYAMLVASATKNFSEETQSPNSNSNESVSDTSQNIVGSKSVSINPKFVSFGVVVILGVALLLFAQRGSNNQPSDSQNQVSVTSDSESNANRENSAKACRDVIGLNQNEYVFMAVRKGFDADSDVSGVVNYETAGSLNGAKSWIESEMRWLKRSLEIVEQIGRPELSIETTAMLRVLYELVDLQIILLDAGSFTEFNQITPKYHVVLNRFFNLDTLRSALMKICAP